MSVTVAAAVVSHHHIAVLLLLLLFKGLLHLCSLQASIPAGAGRQLETGQTERDANHFTLSVERTREVFCVFHVWHSVTVLLLIGNVIIQLETFSKSHEIKFELIFQPSAVTNDYVHYWWSRLKLNILNYSNNYWCHISPEFVQPAVQN